MKRTLSVIALILSTFFFSSAASAATVRTYFAKVVALNDCPQGQARISIPFEKSPMYDPAVSYVKMPDPVTACADVAWVSQAMLDSGYIPVTYQEGKFVGVPQVRTH